MILKKKYINIESLNLVYRVLLIFGWNTNLHLEKSFYIHPNNLIDDSSGLIILVGLSKFLLIYGLPQFFVADYVIIAICSQLPLETISKTTSLYLLPSPLQGSLLSYPPQKVSQRDRNWSQLSISSLHNEPP